MVCKPVELSRVVEWLADRRRSRCIIVETEANERTPPVKTEEHSMTKTLVVERSRELTFFNRQPNVAMQRGSFERR